MVIKYNLVILLCPSGLNHQRNFYEKKDGLYVGSRLRMQAAVDISPKVEYFLLVGGGWALKKDKKWQRVNQMNEFLVKRGIKNEKLIRIVSQKNTIGNLRAIYQCFKKVKGLPALRKKKIGILSNFYHLPRVMRFATEIFGPKRIVFIPISAESVVKKQLKFTSKQKSLIIARIFAEIKGLRDWEIGDYEKQKLSQKEPVGEWASEDEQKLKKFIS